MSDNPYLFHFPNLWTAAKLIIQGLVAWYLTTSLWTVVYNVRFSPLAKIPATNQKDHTRQRKLYAHAFTDTALIEQAPLLNRFFDLLITQLKRQVEGPNQGRVDIQAYYNFTTFDIIGDLAFGEPFGALESGENPQYIKSLAKNVMESIKFLGVLRFAAIYPAFSLAMKIWEILVPSLTAKRLAHHDFTRIRTERRLALETNRKDFITYASLTRFKLGIRVILYILEIIANSNLMVNAGSETSTTVLAGATYYLLKNPDMLRRVQMEVRNAFKTADDITLRALSTPGFLPYLEAVLQEALRCCPPVPAILPRIVGTGGAVIDGYYVPNDVSVGVHQWSTYRSPKNFADPDTFDPERWMTNAPAKYHNDNKAAFQPFSMGPRGCIGKR
ncbi:MAG: hypothetical protein Q9219_002799 [cf. Caloplaca sp. 3 TL-2023]